MQTTNAKDTSVSKEVDTPLEWRWSPSDGATSTDRRGAADATASAGLLIWGALNAVTRTPTGPRTSTEISYEVNQARPDETKRGLLLEAKLLRHAAATNLRMWLLRSHEGLTTARIDG